MKLKLLRNQIKVTEAVNESIQKDQISNIKKKELSMTAIHKIVARQREKA